MPFLKLQSMPSEKKQHIYETLILEMLESQKGIEQATKLFLLRTEILKHKLTKRQRSIITFISTLSVFYAKDKALIPKIMDFELAGVSKTHCAAELEKLEKLKVIRWDRNTNEFEILTASEWEVPINAGFSQDRARELFLLNLKHAGIEVERIIKESLD